MQLKGPGPVAKKKERRVVAVYSFVFSDGPNPTEARVAVAQGGEIKIIRYTYLVATLLIYIVSGMSSFSKKMPISHLLYVPFEGSSCSGVVLG